MAAFHLIIYGRFWVITEVIAAFAAAPSGEKADPNLWATKKAEVVEVWQSAQERFESARLMTALLGDERINEALANLGVSLRQSYSAIAKKAPEERFIEAMNRVNHYHHECVAAIRSALGLPDGDWPDYASIK